MGWDLQGHYQNMRITSLPRLCSHLLGTGLCICHKAAWARPDTGQPWHEGAQGF